MSWVPRVLVPVLVVLASLAPVHADPPPLCAVGEGPSSDLQNDAESGGDAGDHVSVSLYVPGDFAWTGGLELPTPSGPGDQADAYGVQIGAVADNVMVELTSYSGIPYEGLVYVDVFPPGASEPIATIALGDDRVILPPQVGVWSFVVRFPTSGSDASCGSGTPLPVGPPAEIATLFKSYTLYVGCDPICVQA